MLLLFESAGGYALFKVNDGVVNKTDEIFSHFVDAAAAVKA